MGPNKKEDFLNWKLWHEKGPTTIQKKTFFQNLEEKKINSILLLPAHQNLATIVNYVWAQFFAEQGTLMTVLHILSVSVNYLHNCKTTLYLKPGSWEKKMKEKKKN